MSISDRARNEFWNDYAIPVDRNRRYRRRLGVTIFEHACKLGFEGIVSKHREHPYRSGPSKSWLKVKNPNAPGVTRFKEKE
jgi:ATP-dependent DNA ligase